MAGIFLSYRRSDSAGWAGRLHDSLRRLLPSTPVFMDVRDIPPGVDFEQFLDEHVAQCDMLVALIGPQWLDARDQNGQRRLDNPLDHTRIEVQAALKRAIRVVPVLVGGARQPTAAELPEALRPLAKRQNFELSDRAWDEGCQRLAEAIQQALGKPKLEQPAPARSKRPILVALALIAAAVVVVAVFIGVVGQRIQNRQAVPEYPRPVHVTPTGAEQRPPRQVPKEGQQREREIIYEENIDRPNAQWDLELVRVGTRDVHACDPLCLRRSDCKAFVYVRPGAREPEALCILKSELPQALLDQPCCISGVVRARALNK